MLKTTSSVTIPSTYAGLHVVPDIVRVPLDILTTSSMSPLDAANEMAAKIAGIEELLLGAAVAQPMNYASWTEKLVGKGFRGHGIRYHSKVTLVVRREFEDEPNFVARMQSLEGIQTKLTTLDDDDAIAIGAARWGLVDLEAHREAATRQIFAQVQVSAKMFGIDAYEVVGSHALTVDVVGPTSAYVHLDVKASPRSLS